MSKNIIPNIKELKKFKMKKVSPDPIKTERITIKKFNKNASNLKRTKHSNMNLNVSKISLNKNILNSVMTILPQNYITYKNNTSKKNNKLIRLNKLHKKINYNYDNINNLSSSINLNKNNVTVLDNSNKLNNRTKTNIKNLKTIFKKSGSKYNSNFKINKSYIKDNNMNKSITNLKKNKRNYYTEQKRRVKSRIKCNSTITLNRKDTEISNKDKNNLKNIKAHSNDKTKKVRKLSPSFKMKTNYSTYYNNINKKNDDDDSPIHNNIHNSSYILKRKIKIIPMTKESREKSLSYYNKKLKKELDDYKVYKSKYNIVKKKNQKIQSNNDRIIKKYMELKKQLKEMEQKLKKFNIKEEEKKERSKKKNNKKNNMIKNRVTNNFTIQSQVNIIMTEPNLVKRENKKEKEDKKKQIQKNKEKEEKQITNNKIKDEPKKDINKKEKEKEDNKKEDNKKEDKHKNEEPKKPEKKGSIQMIRNSISSIKNNENNKNNNNNQNNDNVIKKSNVYLKILLKNIIKAKDFNIRENLQKYFLRYYYNILCLKKLQERNKRTSIKRKSVEREKININKYYKKASLKNNDINTNMKSKRNIDRIEFKDKDLYTKEELNQVKRNKELRDLFYNKIRERQNYLHKCFTKFYYKGLMIYMKNKYSSKNRNNRDKNETNNVNEIKNKLNEDKNVNTSINNNDNININKSDNITKNSNNINNNINNSDNNNSINNNDNIIKGNNIINNNNNVNESSKRENPLRLARSLRKILSQKNKEKAEILRKYFYKFHHAGIIHQLRVLTKRAMLYKKLEGIDLKTAYKTLLNSKALNEIDIDENSNLKNFEEAFNKKMLDKDFADEMEKNKEEIEKDKHLEEEKEMRIKNLQLSVLEKLLYKADRSNKINLKKALELVYLKSKIMSLDKYKRRKKKAKTLKKDRVRDSIIPIDENDEIQNNNKKIKTRTSKSNDDIPIIKQNGENNNE